MSLRGLVDKFKSARRARRVKKLERAAASHGAPDTRPPIVPQDSSLTPPVNEHWR